MNALFFHLVVLIFVSVAFFLTLGWCTHKRKRSSFHTYNYFRRSTKCQAPLQGYSQPILVNIHIGETPKTTVETTIR